MKISKQNLKVYAAKFYDNPFCISEEEFELDLYKSSGIKKLISSYIQNGETNVKLLVNTTISFYNVFEHHAATNILEFKMNGVQHKLLNAVLFFLSLPQIESQDTDLELLNIILEEYR